MQNDMSKLIVWEKSHELTLNVYKLTNKFPKSEMFGLTSQIRRSAASVPSNIVEGKARNSVKEFIRFLLIARGSLEETRYHLLLAKDLEYITTNDYTSAISLSDDVGRLLNALIKKLQG